MTGRRKSHHHLPDRVYINRGWHFYVDDAGKWHKLGKIWDRSAKERWLELSEGKSADGTVAKLLDDFLELCEGLVRAGKRAKRTYADNEVEARALKLVLGRTAAHLLTSRHVKSYLNKRNDKDGRPAPVRANREIALLSSAYAWAMGRDEWPKIALNPCYGVRRNAEAPRREYVQTQQLVCFGKIAPDWMRRYVLLKRITGLRQGDLLRLTPANITDRGLELVTGKTRRRMRFRWSWGLRVVIDSIVASQGDVKKLALFPARHGGRMSSLGFRAAWARAMTEFVAGGGVKFRENDIRAKTASDASSLARAQELLGHEESSTTARHYRRGVAKVTPLR